MVTSTTVVRSTATLERVQDRIRGTGIMLIVVRKSQESLKSLLTLNDHLRTYPRGTAGLGGGCSPARRLSRIYNLSFPVPVDCVGSCC